MLIPCLCQDGFHGQIWREQNAPVTKEIQHHLWDGKLTSAKSTTPTSKMAGLASMKNAPSIILAGGRGDVGSNILPRTESGSEVRVVLVVLNRRPPTFRVTTSPSLIAIVFNSSDLGSNEDSLSCWAWVDGHILNFNRWELWKWIHPITRGRQFIFHIVTDITIGQEQANNKISTQIL